jgi:hypothetical protein
VLTWSADWWKLYQDLFVRVTRWVCEKILPLTFANLMFAKINTEQKVCNKEDPNFRLAYKHSFAIKKTAQSKYSRKFVQSGQPACFSKDISDCRRYFEQTMTQQISDRNQRDTFESLHQALRCIHSVWHIPKSTSVFSIWSCQSFQRSVEIGVSTLSSGWKLWPGRTSPDVIQICVKFLTNLRKINPTNPTNICKPNLAYFTSILQKNWFKTAEKNLSYQTILIKSYKNVKC